MKQQLFCAFIFYYVVLSSTRLVQKTTEKPKDSNNGVKDKSTTGEKIDGPEIVHFYKGKERTPRQGENNRTISSSNKQNKAQVKTPLVKKPIPKFNEIDSDEEYRPHQMKGMPPKFLDLFDNEDEDFSLNDYDFDVNHDEFVGRGNPLEPRKDIAQHSGGTKSNSAQKIKRNLAVNKNQNSVEHLMKVTRKAIYKVADEINNNFPRTKTEIVRESNQRKVKEDSSDESYNSNLYPRFVRNERSPWLDNVDKFGEKSSSIKFLSFLPMFPQIPGVHIPDM